MSTLRIPIPDPANESVSLRQLLDLLSPDKLGTIHQMVRTMREAFQCPYIARDYNDFLRVIYDYFTHYQLTFFNADIKRGTVHHQTSDYWKDLSMEFMQKHLGSYQGDLRTAERNAVTGRDGGMIAIIDAMTDSLTKLHTKLYVERVFREYIPQSDLDTRMRLAQELLKQYGDFLFKGEELLPYFFLGMNIEEVIQAFVNHLHNIRRNLRA
jgi:hypothetical protein